MPVPLLTFGKACPEGLGEASDYLESQGNCLKY